MGTTLGIPKLFLVGAGGWIVLETDVDRSSDDPLLVGATDGFNQNQTRGEAARAI